MAIRKVARMGHPILRQKARELTAEEIRSPETTQLITDMLETMREYGGIGLAAPQIHESLQIALIGMDAQGAEMEVPEVFFNPVITILDPEVQGYWEGCLSVPDLRGLVFRPKRIRVDYWDAHARPKSVEAEGFRATVFQHELDHLAGILYVDRMEDTTRFAFIEEYQRFWVPSPDSAVGELKE